MANFLLSIHFFHIFLSKNFETFPRSIILDKLKSAPTPTQNGLSKENYATHQEVMSQAQLGSSTESKVIMETTRTTSATMRMEHKTNFPDLPITFSQRTQTPTIPHISEGTSTETSFKQEVKSQTEGTQTPIFKPVVAEPQKPAEPFVQSIPFPFLDSQPLPSAPAPEPLKKSALDFFETNLKNLPPLQEDKYTRYEDLVKESKTYVHKQNEVKEQFHSKLHEDLSYLNLVPEPPPEMGFMPKVGKVQPEKIVDKVKKLEEIHQASEMPLSGTVFPTSFKKEEKYSKKEFVQTSTIGTSPFVQPTTSPLPTRCYTPQPNRDQLFTPDPNMNRAASPRPSNEAVNMEKLWTLKAKSPEPFSQHQQQQQQQSFSHETKSSFVAYTSSQQTHSHQMIQQESAQPMDCFVPIQPYATEPQHQEELPKMSIKDTKSFFEQRIKQEEVKPMHHDLKAPGLVRQFAKPMVPLIPLDIEPGEAPEICYAPKPVYERKQSYVEKIEKTLEQSLDKEPEKVPRGGVRIIPTRQTPQRSIPPDSPQKFVEPKPVFVQPPPPVVQPSPPVVQPQPVIQPEPLVLQETFLPQIQQQHNEFKSETYEFKKESSMFESSAGYRHVEPPKFLQRARSTDPAPIPPSHYDLPKPEPFKPAPMNQQAPREVPIAIQKPEPMKPFVPQAFKPEPVKPIVPQFKPEPVPQFKPEPVQQFIPEPHQPPKPQYQPEHKPNLQQHAPVTQPKPLITPKQKFSNEFMSETHETINLYKNFVKSEESTHSTESYFQKIETPKLVPGPQPQYLTQEPPKQTFVQPPQQVRKKRYADVML